MAHDPSSPPKFLVPETGNSNFARVPCILVPVSCLWCAQLGHNFLVTSFWYQKLGRRTWVVCHPPKYQISLIRDFKIRLFCMDLSRCISVTPSRHSERLRGERWRSTQLVRYVASISARRHIALAASDGVDLLIARAHAHCRTSGRARLYVGHTL